MIKQYLPFILILILFVGCAANRYAKKGAEFEKVGYYEKAADMYYMALQKNANHVDATIGLRSNGQRKLDKLFDEFMAFYNQEEYKQAVYKYVDCEVYNKKVGALGINLNFKQNYKEYYTEVKKVYLNKLYDEAYLLLEDELFSKAEVKFSEILKLDPNYGDVEELKRKAHYEPIYRKGKKQMQNNKFRSAYYSFKEITDALSEYKDAAELKETALENAIITIAVADFTNLTNFKGIESQFEGAVEKQLNSLRSPFIKIVDRENEDKITSEQLLTLEGKVDDVISSKAGKMLGVKALFTAEISSYSIKKGKLKKVEKKGYLKEIKKINKDGQEVKKTIYHKTKYYEYEQENKVACQFQFKLISTETSEVMVADAMTITKSDRIHYITFNGNGNNLVKGNWVSIKKKSSKDEVLDNIKNNSEIKRLLKANKSIKSIENLQSEILNTVSQRAARKVKKYDPEK